MTCHKIQNPQPIKKKLASRYFENIENIRKEDECVWREMCGLRFWPKRVDLWIIVHMNLISSHPRETTMVGSDSERWRWRRRPISCYASSMAFHCVRYSFSPSPGKPNFKLVQRNNPVLLFSSFPATRASYNTLVSEVPFLFPYLSFDLFLVSVVYGIAVFCVIGDWFKFGRLKLQVWLKWFFGWMNLFGSFQSGA